MSLMTSCAAVATGNKRENNTRCPFILIRFYYALRTSHLFSDLLILAGFSYFRFSSLIRIPVPPHCGVQAIPRRGGGAAPVVTRRRQLARQHVGGAPGLGFLAGENPLEEPLDCPRPWPAAKTCVFPLTCRALGNAMMLLTACASCKSSTWCLSQRKASVLIVRFRRTLQVTAARRPSKFYATELEADSGRRSAAVVA